LSLDAPRFKRKQKETKGNKRKQKETKGNKRKQNNKSVFKQCVTSKTFPNNTTTLKTTTLTATIPPLWVDFLVVNPHGPTVHCPRTQTSKLNHWQR
jgi:hypothetical protein